MTATQSGIIRLLDCKNFTNRNRTSIITPPAFRPNVKLRSRSGHLEIVEKAVETNETGELDDYGPVKDAVILSLSIPVVIALHGATLMVLYK